MPTEYWEPSPPATKFAPKFRVPLYTAKDGSQDFIERLKKYILDIEKNIISQEKLVSEVPKPIDDPYQYTQQWKQHNLLQDTVGLGGETITRFPENPVIEELFQRVRLHYLTHMANCRIPRQRIWIHSWANVLRGGEWISRHTHITGPESFLAGTYYLTTNNTNLWMQNPANTSDTIGFSTEMGKFVFFPSWLPHWSDKCEESSLRISIAFDFVTENTVIGNPWRPHRLLDDPSQMTGLEGY